MEDSFHQKFMEIPDVIRKIKKGFVGLKSQIKEVKSDMNQTSNLFSE